MAKKIGKKLRKNGTGRVPNLGRDASQFWDGTGRDPKSMKCSGTGRDGTGRDPKSMGRFWDGTRTWWDALGLGSKILSGTRPDPSLVSTLLNDKLVFESNENSDLKVEFVSQSSDRQRQSFRRFS